MTAHLVTPIVSLTLLATVTTACTTTAGVTTATTTDEGSALAKNSSANLGKGQLIGTGVGSAAGAVYDVRKRR